MRRKSYQKSPPKFQTGPPSARVEWLPGSPDNPPEEIARQFHQWRGARDATSVGGASDWSRKLRWRHGAVLRAAGRSRSPLAWVEPPERPVFGVRLLMSLLVCEFSAPCLVLWESRCGGIVLSWDTLRATSGKMRHDLALFAVTAHGDSLNSVPAEAIP